MNPRNGVYVILGALVCLMTFLQASAVVVNFPDANLDAVIREAISKPTENIIDTDLLTLTYLEARGKNISDLSGNTVQIYPHCSLTIT